MRLSITKRFVLSIYIIPMVSFVVSILAWELLKNPIPSIVFCGGAIAWYSYFISTAKCPNCGEVIIKFGYQSRRLARYRVFQIPVKCEHCDCSFREVDKDGKDVSQQ